MYKRDSERDEPPEWWETAYDWDVEFERYWYDGAEIGWMVNDQTR